MPRTHVAARAPLLVILAAIALVTAMLTPLSAQASSHREAPMISRDPTADNTDLYAFRSPDGSNTVTIVANFIPLEEPAGGPNFNAFDDNVLYELKVDAPTLPTSSASRPRTPTPTCSGPRSSSTTSSSTRSATPTCSSARPTPSGA